MAQLSDCEVKGNGLKSKEVTYIPKEIKSGMDLLKILKANFNVKETLKEIVKQQEVLL